MRTRIRKDKKSGFLTVEADTQAKAMRTLQTGDANYNAAAVALGVLILLILLAVQ